MKVWLLSSKWKCAQRRKILDHYEEKLAKGGSRLIRSSCQNLNCPFSEVFSKPHLNNPCGVILHAKFKIRLNWKIFTRYCFLWIERDPHLQVLCLLQVSQTDNIAYEPLPKVIEIHKTRWTRYGNTLTHPHSHHTRTHLHTHHAHTHTTFALAEFLMLNFSDIITDPVSQTTFMFRMCVEQIRLVCTALSDEQRSPVHLRWCPCAYQNQWFRTLGILHRGWDWVNFCATTVCRKHSKHPQCSVDFLPSVDGIEVWFSPRWGYKHSTSG